MSIAVDHLPPLHPPPIHPRSWYRPSISSSLSPVLVHHSACQMPQPVLLLAICSCQYSNSLPAFNILLVIPDPGLPFSSVPAPACPPHNPQPQPFLLIRTSPLCCLSCNILILVNTPAGCHPCIQPWPVLCIATWLTLFYAPWVNPSSLLSLSLDHPCHHT